MKDLLPAIDVPLTVLLATPFMFLLFMGIIVWVYSKHRKHFYQEAERLPLANDSTFANEYNRLTDTRGH